jgi:hypothetical protein
MKKGDLAICSRGQLGLITSPFKSMVEYADETVGYAWVGIHLTDGVGHKIGDPWSSRNPYVFGNINQWLADKLVEFDPFHDEGNATNHRLSQCDDRCKLDHLPEGSH